MKEVTRRSFAKPNSLGSDASRVLYVEDEDDNWEISHTMLRERFRLQRARNAKEAFAVLCEQEFDVILMDIQLSESDLDGIQITQALTGRRPLPSYVTKLQVKKKTPIIFVTAYQGLYSKEPLVAAGGDDLITKPVDFTKLALAITRYIIHSGTKSSIAMPAYPLATGAAPALR